MIAMATTSLATNFVSGPLVLTGPTSQTMFTGKIISKLGLSYKFYFSKMPSQPAVAARLVTVLWFSHSALPDWPSVDTKTHERSKSIEYRRVNSSLTPPIFSR